MAGKNSPYFQRFNLKQKRPTTSSPVRKRKPPYTGGKLKPFNPNK
jgi:hypothetical protein